MVQSSQEMTSQAFPSNMVTLIVLSGDRACPSHAEAEISDAEVIEDSLDFIGIHGQR